jgi:DNA-binding CsgD family transcriptional regulator
MDKELTERESEILTLLCSDLSLQEVAEDLFISYNTVQFHVKNMKKKCNIKNLHGLVAFNAEKNNTIYCQSN